MMSIYVDDNFLVGHEEALIEAKLNPHLTSKFKLKKLPIWDAKS